jgi:uncharacterized membrane protein YgcG
VKRRLASAILVAATVVAILPGPVAAATIPRLSGSVTDTVGVLSDRAAIETALSSLLDEHDVQLFVVFVSTTEELSAPDFATETADTNSLGANDALLLVATDDRTDAIWVSEALDEITNEEIDSIIADTLEPGLRDGDFDQAVIDTAAVLGDAAASAAPTNAPPVATSGPGSTPIPQGSGSTGDGGLGLLGILLVAVGAVILVVFGARWLGGFLTTRRAAEERDRRTGRLAREANALLVATDERIRTAQQETDYVEAAFGAGETEPLRTAIADAQADLRAAFEVRQRLDDAEPEDPPTREAMLNEIVARTKRAQAALDRETERIRALRDLERDAPTVVNELVPRLAAVEARLPAADAALTELLAIAPAATDSVRGNLAEARKGLAGARTALDAARAAIAKHDSRSAAKQARLAIVGTDGATALVDAVEKLAAAVRDASARVPQELDAAEAGIREAADTIRSASVASSGGVDEAEAALRSARSALASGDPLAALRSATEAHRAADTAVAAARQSALERERLLATAEASIATAQTDIDRASTFIATRRTGVGRAARTRLAEAERNLEVALSLRPTDPHQAIAIARRAEQLAEQAYSLAADDFNDWDAGGRGAGRPGGGSDVLGAILGGVIGGVLSGGGRGGGWGGSPWGSGGPFGGGGGWGGGGGPFGGGGGGPFGGGGFGGGGGGRSRGGRW